MIVPGWVTYRAERRAAGDLDPREAEIEDLEVAVGRPHHVLGLQIAVHDPLAVGFGERRGQLVRRPADLVAAVRLAGLDLVAEGVAVHVLSGDEHVAPELLERIDGADPRVRQQRGGSRLAP